MTKIAKDYHENLQKRPEMTSERIRAIEEMEKVTEMKLNKKQMKSLSEKTTKEEIKIALKNSKMEHHQDQTEFHMNTTKRYKQ